MCRMGTYTDQIALGVDSSHIEFILGCSAPLHKSTHSLSDCIQDKKWSFRGLCAQLECAQYAMLIMQVCAESRLEMHAFIPVRRQVG